jgi:serine/threonine protein kinase
MEIDYDERKKRSNEFNFIAAQCGDNRSDGAIKKFPPCVKHHQEFFNSIWHPNIIYIYEPFVEINLRRLEYCPRGTIADHVANGPLPNQQLYRISEQLINALRACHATKIAHGDINQHNIFLSKHGRAKLVDFGLAIIHETDPSCQFKGSIGYLAPEVLRHDAFDWV